MTQNTGFLLSRGTLLAPFRGSDKSEKRSATLVSNSQIDEQVLGCPAKLLGLQVQRTLLFAILAPILVCLAMAHVTFPTRPSGKRSPSESALWRERAETESRLCGQC